MVDVTFQCKQREQTSHFQTNLPPGGQKSLQMCVNASRPHQAASRGNRPFRERSQRACRVSTDVKASGFNVSSSAVMAFCGKTTLVITSGARWPTHPRLAGSHVGHVLCLIHASAGQTSPAPYHYITYCRDPENTRQLPPGSD